MLGFLATFDVIRCLLLMCLCYRTYRIMRGIMLAVLEKGTLLLM
jgi:hypothetical protein